MEKAGLIGLVKIRYIETDDNLTLRGDKLKEAIEKDRENGYVPFFVSITFRGRSQTTLARLCQLLNIYPHTVDICNRISLSK